MKTTILKTVLSILTLALGCVTAACAPVATSNAQVIKNFEKKINMTKEAAHNLAKAAAEKDGRSHWVRKKCYLIEGRYFFPREVSKLKYVKDWGYSVDPKSRVVTYRDFRPKKFKIIE